MVTSKDIKVKLEKHVWRWRFGYRTKIRVCMFVLTTLVTINARVKVHKMEQIIDLYEYISMVTH